MARIKYGSLVSDISGSIGSATFQKSLYGNTLRSKPNPRRSATPAQINCRQYMVLCHQAWRGLSDAGRRQWNQYINFTNASINRDKTILLTGHALFIKWNFLRLTQQYAIVTDLVYSAIPTWPTILSLNCEVDNVAVHFSHNLNDIPCWPVLFLSANRPPSRSFFKAGLRCMLGGSNDDAWVNYALKYKNAFGVNIAVGNTIHYEVQYFCTEAPIISAFAHGILVAAAI